MISYLEMAQRFPAGAEVDIPVSGDGPAAGGSAAGVSSVRGGAPDSCGEIERRRVIGYEYCNGRGYLLLDRDEKREIDSLERDKG